MEIFVLVKECYVVHGQCVVSKALLKPLIPNVGESEVYYIDAYVMEALDVECTKKAKAFFNEKLNKLAWVLNHPQLPTSLPSLELIMAVIRRVKACT